MSDDLGFTFKQSKNGEVKISHRGKPATTLRTEKAAHFLEEIAHADVTTQQQEMARITGNYKRGNERNARNHPRNR